MPVFSKIFILALGAGTLGVQAQLIGGGSWNPDVDQALHDALDTAMPSIPAPSIDPADAAAAWSAYRAYTEAMAARSSSNAAPSATSSGAAPLITAQPTLPSGAPTTFQTAVRPTGKSSGEADPTPTSPACPAKDVKKLITGIANAIASGDNEELQEKIHKTLSHFKNLVSQDGLEDKVKELISKIPSSLPKKVVKKYLGKLANVLSSDVGGEELQTELSKLESIFSALE